MTENVRFATRLSPDRQRVTVALMMDDQTLGFADVESSELEELIALLATRRAEMAEPVVPEIEPNTRLTAIIDPAWRAKTASPVAPDGVLLALRHPGLGWITSLFSRAEVVRLGQSLLSLAASAPLSERGQHHLPPLAGDGADAPAVRA
jgi:hypothetical protein